MCSNIVALISIITTIYLFIDSFRTGCLWPIIILLFGPITILIYILISYEGNKPLVLACYYAPLLLAITGKLILGV